MLRSLKVSNLAIVEHTEVSFTPGLNVITGETGAGKSVLMHALDLALGGRADASAVREHASEAEVEANFGDHVLRRTITASGRSRAWIDEESVSLAELKELGSHLVDIHGPTANQRLRDEAFQRDQLAVPAHILSDYATAYKAFDDVRQREAALQADVGEDEIDLLSYQVGELTQANLTEADETLAERHATAAHAEEIVDAANDITEALGGERSVAEILARLQPRFAGLARRVSAAAEWAREAEEITVRAQELSRTVADFVSGLDAGEEDLAALDARLTLVNNLSRKYLKTAEDRARGIPRLIEILTEKRTRLEDLTSRDARLAELVKQREACRATLMTCAAALTQARKTTAAKFAKAVMRHLHDLGFAKAVFEIALTPIEPTPQGADRVTFLFGPNPGEPLRPLADIASSGEVARVMLAIKALGAQPRHAHDTPVLVFDEIDANIGGEIGSVVGARLRAIAKNEQVIAITHLPQSAVWGDNHLVVAKSVSEGRTRTVVAAVEGAERISEIARMLGGEKITSVVRKHAEELLEHAR